MTNRPTSPRIAPLRPDELDEEARELLVPAGALADSVGGGALNIFATLVRHPGLFRKWLPFGGKLLAGKLPPRERELVILRTGWRCESDYEWGQHVIVGRVAGLTVDEIARIKDGPDAAGWDELDATLLRAADELHDDNCIGDDTWSALAKRYDDKQLIELVMLVGHYHMVAFTLNSLAVQREPGVPGLEGP
jgi:4-carboxymuconolactone decarboxylase